MLYKYYKKTLLVLIILVTLCISLSSVCAEDLGNTDVSQTSLDSNISDLDVLNDARYNTVKIYVDSNVNVSGNGTQANPYKTIGEAVNMTNASKDVVIYLANGVYNVSGNYNFNIDLNHTGMGGTLSFVGNDVNKTIIDLCQVNKFLAININSRVILKNLWFINECGGYTGALINNQGNLTIINCKASDSKPSGSLIHSTNKLYCYNSSFSNIKLSGTYSDGGVIQFSSPWSSYTTNATLVLDNCSFDNCSARYGGAIYGYGSTKYGNIVSITNSRFDNIFQSIYLQDAVVFISNSVFLNNTALSNSINGAAINSLGKTQTNIVNCTFINGTAKNGGAIYSNSNFVTCINDSKFINNSAIIGGAICGGIFNCKNNYFENNHASTKGGAIYDYNYIILKNNTVVNSYSPLDKFIYLENNNLNSSNYVVVLNNSTINVTSKTVLLTASITDDNGNLITCINNYNAPIKFYINNVFVGSSFKIINGTTSYELNKILYGVNNVSAFFNDYSVIKTGTIVANIANNSDVYVAMDGDDVNGNGTFDNPYATIEKALMSCSNSINSNLHIKNGTYYISNYLNIDTVGGNLSIIGYGGKVTIDLNKSTYLANIALGSFVSLYNLDIINGVQKTWSQSYHGILNVFGNLIVDNCSFINNEGYNTGAIYATSNSVLNIFNSKFINNTGLYASGYGDILYVSGICSIANSSFYAMDGRTYSSVYLTNAKEISIDNSTFIGSEAIKSSNSILTVNNSKFINNSAINGGSIYLNGGILNLNNNIFINSTATNRGAAIYLSSGDLYLTNNTVNNCASLNDNYIYSQGVIYNVVVEILGNKSIEMESFGVTLNAKIFDDNGNQIVIDYVDFYLNDEFIGKGSPVNNEMVLNYKKLLNGTYAVSLNSYYLSNFTLKTATLKITPLMNREIYVAITGSDVSGNGSKNNPYRTLDKAMEVANAYNNVVHLGEGTFNLSEGLNIATGGGKFTILGNGINTIIDLNQSSRFIDSISSDSIVQLTNLTIANARSTANGGSILNAGNLTINNVSIINSTSKRMGGSIYNTGYLYVLNSKFINSTSTRQGGVIYNTKYLYLKNNTMINTTASAGIYVFTSGKVDNVIVTVMNNGTYNITGSSIALNATITDDNGHKITATASNNNLLVKFLLNGTQITTAYLKDGIATATASVNLNGQFIVSASFGTSENVIVKIATLNFNNTLVLNEVWVATNGSDTAGNGSKNNPFATITKALTVASALNGIIHIMDGNYILSSKITISNLINLTIFGEGANVIINGSDKVQLFKITSTSFVNLVNLRLTGSYFNQTVSEHGAIRNEGILNLINCRLDNNWYKINTWSYWDNPRGTVIFNSGTLNIVNSTFDNNHFYCIYTGGAPQGGVIYSSGNLNIVNSTFKDNLLYAGTSAYGGVIYATSNVIINASTFINNGISSAYSSYHCGGVIYITGSLIIYNSSFKSNYIKDNNQNGNYKGSVVYSTNEFTVTNSNFTENYLMKGTDCICGESNYKKEINNCYFKGNYGSIFLNKGSDNLIKNCTFIENENYIIRLFACTMANVTDCIVNSSSDIQKGIYVSGGTAYIYNNNVTAVNGGAFYIDNSAKIYVFNNTISSCVADYGAVAYVNKGILNIYNNTLINNKANIAGNYIYLGNNGKIDGSRYTLIFNNNGTFEIYGTNFIVNATLFDSDNNPICGAKITFKLNSTVIGNILINENGTAILKGSIAAMDEYTLSGLSNNIANQSDCTILNATLIFRPILLRIFYVDPVFGDDLNNGSKKYPFASLSKAIIEASKAINGTIYLMPGYYSSLLDQNIDILIGEDTSLNIIGLTDESGEKVIFDLGNKNNYLLNISSRTTNLNNTIFSFKNIEIINGNISKNIIKINNTNVIFDSIKVYNNYQQTGSYSSMFYIMDSYISMNNVTFKNNTGELMNIFNSNFNITNMDVVNCIKGNYHSLIRLIDGENSFNYSNYIINSSFANNNGNVLYVSFSSTVFKPSKLNITDSIFLNNTVAYSYSIIFVNKVFVSIYNSVFLDNSGGGAVILSNWENHLTIDTNWWGCNNNPNIVSNLIIGARANNWIVAELISNNSDIKVGDNVKLNLIFKYNNGSSLVDFVPTRIAEFIGNATFNGLSNLAVAIVNNSAKVNAIALNGGIILVNIDNQNFKLNITKLNTVLTAVKSINYGDTNFTVSLVDELGIAVVGEVINLKINGVNYTATTNDKGIATFQIAKLNSNNYTAIYTFNSTGKYLTSTNSSNLTVNKVNSNIKVDVNDINIGENLVINVTLPADATGNVSIKVNNKTEIVPIVNGKATLSVPNLSGGTYLVTVTYAGDGNYLNSTGSSSAKVNKLVSNILVSASNILVGKNETIQVTVTNGATGNVTITVNGKTETVLIVNNKASLTLSNLSYGEYTVLATYNGDSNYLSSTAATSFKVKLASCISIVVSDVFVGEDVVIRAILPSNATGNVVFIVNAKQEKVTINNGVATLTVKNLAVDSYTVIAKYEGNDIYSPSENNTSFSVNKKDTSVNVVIGDFVYGDEIKGTVKLTTIPDNIPISDTVVITVNNKNYTVNVVNGKANFTIDKLEVGKYNLTIKYKGNKNYTNSYNSYLINIKKATITKNNITAITNYNNLTVNVDLPADATGNITVKIDDKTYSTIIKDGKATININNLENKQYNLSIIYSGSHNYNPLTKNTKITINDNRTTLTSSNVIMYYKDGTRYIIKLTDIKGNPLANQTVTISIHGMTYNRTTDRDGKTSLGLNLAPGFYPVNVLFKGTNTYAKANTSTNVTIKSTINGDNIVKIYKNGTQYYATFLNSDGTPLANKNVTFNIYGVFYKRPTNNMGVARLNINLHPGKYIITAIHPDNGQMFSNNITVLSSISGKNIVKHYRNGTQYYATFLNSDGTPLANRNVTFNIYGVFYTRTTNNMGVAKLNINLHPGDYIITAIHPDNGQMFSNNIKVLPTLLGKDLTKKYGNTAPYEVRLVDGKGLPISGTSIRLNIYGVFYNRLTDSNGIARLNINLMPGEYIVTSYYNDAATSNTIRVTN